MGLRNRQMGFGLLAYGLVALGTIVALGVVAMNIRQAGYDAAMVAVNEASEKHRKVEEKRIEKAVEKLEVKREKARVVYRTIQKDVDKLVLVYRDRPCLDDDGLRIVRDAVSGKTADPGKPNESLPAPPTTR